MEHKLLTSSLALSVFPKIAWMFF